MAQGRSWYQGQRRMFWFTRGMGRAAQISAPWRHTQPAWGWGVWAGGEDLVLGRHFCSRQKDAPRGEGRKKRLKLLFSHLGQCFNSNQKSCAWCWYPKRKSILEKHPKPSTRALGSWGQPVCHSTGNMGAAAPLTSCELGCSVLLLSDLFHQLQVMVTGFLVVHHGEGVILTWTTWRQSLYWTQQGHFPRFKILPAFLKRKCLILLIKEKSSHFDIRAFKDVLEQE